MTREPDAPPAHELLQARLLSLLQAGDVDGALRAGLMGYAASAGATDAPIRQMQQQLHSAWAARERHRAREARLVQRAADRAERRRPTGPSTDILAPAAATPDAPTPSLPAAAAAALARARARAAGRPDG